MGQIPKSLFTGKFYNTGRKEFNAGPIFSRKPSLGCNLLREDYAVHARDLSATQDPRRTFARYAFVTPKSPTRSVPRTLKDVLRKTPRYAPIKHLMRVGAIYILASRNFSSLRSTCRNEILRYRTRERSTAASNCEKSETVNVIRDIDWIRPADILSLYPLSGTPLSNEASSNRITKRLYMRQGNRAALCGIRTCGSGVCQTMN